MAAAIREAHSNAQIELIQGGGGDFIVIANGQQLWHKRQMGDQFPAHDDILAKL